MKNLIKRLVPRPILNGLMLVFYWIYNNLVHPTNANVKSILRRTGIKNLDFFKRKVPKSECYPYTVHYPITLKYVPERLKSFYLIGRNWKRHPEKPFALVFGFNDWKYGFVSEYLADYRAAFAPRNFMGTLAHRKVRKLKTRPEAIFVWGYTTPPWLQKYAQKHAIPFFRIEDGFVRSSKLGAAHTTPYSLVISPQGMHYNHNEPNHLENILNEYDFANDKDLIVQSQQAQKLLIDGKISKYNLPLLKKTKQHFSIKTKKRVLVLGQVEKDAAVRLGNPKGWSMIDIVRLARLENPDAEILYRPHPDVYAGYQKTIFRNWQTTNFATVVPPDIPLLHSLENVDHVYTITSLSGLEALIRNIKVTVLGTPFYAGWGLTDDRVTLQRRKRSLNIDELFAGIYLKYPTYLADLDDPFIGLQSACMRITADRKLGELELFDDVGFNDQAQLNALATSQLWPKLILDPSLQIETIKPLALKAFKETEIDDYFRTLEGERARKAIAFLIAGWIDEDSQRDSFILKIRELVSLETLNVLLLDLNTYRPGVYLIKHFSWLLEEYQDPRSSAVFVELQIAKEEQIRLDEEKALKGTSENNNEEVNESSTNITTSTITHEQGAMLHNLMNAQLIETHYDEAEKAALSLMANGRGNPKLLLILAQISKHMFDFASCYNTSSLLLTLGTAGPLHKAMTLIAETTLINESGRYLEDLALYLALKPEKFVNIQIELQRGKEGVNIVKTENYLQNFLRLSNDLTIPKIQGYLAENNPIKALEITETLLRNQENTPRLSVLYSQVLTLANETVKAKNIMAHAMTIENTSIVYREAMRVCVLLGDYTYGLKLLREAEKKKIDLGDMTPRKIFLGARMPFEAHQTFKNFHLKKATRQHYPNKYCNEPLKANPSRKLFGIPIFGPGDEIRFASLYGLLDKSLPHTEIKIGCSPRLKPLMRRSFPKVEFVPVNRIRNSDTYEISQYNQVRSSSLIGCLDNTAVRCIDSCDDFILVTDLLADFFPTYEAFPGTAYLKANIAKTKKLKARLPNRKTLVGLSWRSSLTTHSRNEHYLNIEELAPIFELDHIQFVNLQYDECSEELAWVEKHYPGKLVNLEDIDQYNDFDSVASLMKCMDLIISPATTVVELAGALGCPTWLLSNSSELHWRKLEGTQIDVWHNSITHVEGDVVQNKESLVNNLYAKLKKFR